MSAILSDKQLIDGLVQKWTKLMEGAVDFAQGYFEDGTSPMEKRELEWELMWMHASFGKELKEVRDLFAAREG